MVLALTLFASCRAAEERRVREMIPADELLRLAQETTRANYTYDSSTGLALVRAAIPRPQPPVDARALESLLQDAGFRIRPVGPPELNVLRIEPARD